METKTSLPCFSNDGKSERAYLQSLAFTQSTVCSGNTKPILDVWTVITGDIQVTIPKVRWWSEALKTASKKKALIPDFLSKVRKVL